MKKLIFLLMFPIALFGQGQYIPARTVFGTVNGITRPIAGATVTVCAANTGGIPCSPGLANTVFQDSGLTVPLSNPFTTDSNGNYPQAAVASGTYTVTESASGYVGFSYQLTITCTPTGSCTFGPIAATSANISGSLSAGSLNVSGSSTLQAVTATSVAVSGAATAKTLQGVPHCKDFATPGVTSFDAMMTACVAALGATGTGTVNAQDVTDTTNLTMTANWTMSRSGTTVLFPCATITQGTFGMIVPAPTSDIHWKGCSPWGTTPSGSVNGTFFTYSGTGTAHSFGTAGTQSFGHVIEDITCQLTNTAGSHCFDSTEVYGVEFNRVRGLASSSANTNVFIQNSGLPGPPGSQSMTLRGIVENNFQTGFLCTSLTSPPGCNNVQMIGGQFSGNSATGSIAIDVEQGNDIELYGPYVGGYDTGLKVNSPSARAVFGVFHAESCTTQGILLTASAVNNQIWTDTSCTITDSGGLANQNTVHGNNVTSGQDVFFGRIFVTGTTNTNDFNNTIQVKGNAGLPSSIGSNLFFAGGFGSPNLGRIYCGSNTGWQLNFSEHNSGSDVDLFRCRDGGAWDYAERPAQSGAAGFDTMYADQTAHVLRWNPNNTGFQNLPQAAEIPTNYTNATTTFSTVTGMSWAILANANYKLDCTFVGQGSVTTAGPKFQITGPASPTLVKLMVDGGTNTTAYANGVATGFSSANTTLGTLGAGTTDFIWHVNASIVNGANAGTVALQAAANGAGTVTISGGYCQLQ